MFWPEADRDAARGVLRRTLSALRSAVDDPGLRIERTQVALERGVSVDLAEVERLASSGTRPDLEAAAGLIRGPFLAGFALRDSPAFDDWQAARAEPRGTAGGGPARAPRRRLAGTTATAQGRSTPPGGAWSSIRSTRPASAGSSSSWRAPATGPARSGGIARWSRCSIASSACRRCARPPSCTRRSARGRCATETAAPRSPDPRSRLQPVAAPVSLPLVGRAAELERLVRAWRSAVTDGRLALVEGEAGIGKTRLGEALASVVRAGGGRVMASRGYPGEGAVAYGPIAGLLHAGVGLPGGPERLAALDEPVRLELGRLFDLPPALAGRGADPARRRERPRPLPRCPGDRAGRPGRGTAARPALGRRPPSRRRAKSRRAGLPGPPAAGRPVLLLVGWRREDLSPDGRRLLPTTSPGILGATVVSLGRLDRSAIADLVAAARPVGVDAGRPTSTIDDLLAESEGLPLYVVEALAGGSPDGPGMPRSVQALLRDRIASVGEAAAPGARRGIGHRSIVRSADRPCGQRPDEEETIDALEELIRRGIVRESSAAGGAVRYDFSHGRLRDAAYEATSLARRRLLHRRTAEALRRRPATTGHDPIARFALIGAHEREAGRPAEAVAAYLEAARGPRRSTRTGRRSTICVVAGAGNPNATAANARIGELRSRLGEYPGAIAALETAAALASPASCRRSRSPSVASTAGAATSRPRPATSSPRSPRRTSDDDLRARALAERASSRCVPGPRDRFDDGPGARAAAVRAGDPHLAGLAERLVGLVARARGDLGAAREALERSVTLAATTRTRRPPSPRSPARAGQAAAGAVDEAVASAEQAVAACRLIGDRTWRPPWRTTSPTCSTKRVAATSP